MYTSVGDLINEFKEEFDTVAIATKKAKKLLKERGEKADKLAVDNEANLIMEEWEEERQRGIVSHNELNKKELEVNPNAILEGRSGDFRTTEEICKSYFKLKNNKTYLEKLLASNKYKVIGYVDKISVSRGTINITDNKFVKKIYYGSSYKLPNGMTIKGGTMNPPLAHLDACNYNEFCLQLSLYMYLAWENNKDLRVGKLFIRHIILNENSKNISDELIEVPYLKKEVISMLKYKLLNES